MARLVGQWLSGRLGQQFVIENRPGANSSIATKAAVRAPADGYTMLVVTATNTINTTPLFWPSHNHLAVPDIRARTRA